MNKAPLLVATVVVVAGLGPAIAIAGAQSDTGTECEFPVEKTDATGTAVRVDAEPQRVVTLTPSAAQTMWEIGGKDKVVGVTQYAAYLDGASSKANISGGGRTINVEEVIDLQPDLVLVPNASLGPDGIQTLRDSGATVYHFREAGSLQDIIDKTRLTGQLTGECEGADAAVTRMESRLATVDRAVDGQDRPNVLYVFFGYTAGEGTFIHTVIERAGGNNVAADAGISGYKPISDEVVVNRTVDWLLLNSDAPTVPKSAAYNDTRAVQSDQVIVVDANHVSQPAPRIVDVVSKLAQRFHPEAYAAANETTTPTPTPTATDRTGSTTSPATTAPEETATPGTDGPGLGVGVAITALVVTGLLARRLTA